MTRGPASSAAAVEGDTTAPSAARTLPDPGGDGPSVTVVATPDDGSCGIGAYAGDLVDALAPMEASTLAIDQDEQTVRYFLALAVRAMATDDEVVHVQHEYGLFRRDGSRWAGVLGLVFFPALYLLNALRRKVVVVTMHSVLRPRPEEASLPIRLYLRVMHRLVAAGADHLVFLSEGCAGRFRADVPLAADEYSVLPHGVNVADATGETTATSKRRLGYDPEDTVVAIPGYVRPPKGHDIFVETAAALPEYEFLVAGGPRPKGEDADFAAEVRSDAPENVTFTGVVADEEFPRVLNAADLAFLPYRVVTQSGTFNWCAAQSLPVLASDEPYFRRLAEEWGCVETVDIEDRESIRDRLGALLASEKRLEELRANVGRYREENSFRRVGAMHRQIYDWERRGSRGSPVSDRSPEPADD
jgi:glycosyltransferase involved in cell wall biosynthesis